MIAFAFCKINIIDAGVDASYFNLRNICNVYEEMIANNSIGKVADDQYHRYKVSIKLFLIAD